MVVFAVIGMILIYTGLASAGTVFTVLCWDSRLPARRRSIPWYPLARWAR